MKIEIDSELYKKAVVRTWDSLPECMQFCLLLATAMAAMLSLGLFLAIFGGWGLFGIVVGLVAAIALYLIRKFKRALKAVKEGKKYWEE